MTYGELGSICKQISSLVDMMSVLDKNDADIRDQIKKDINNLLDKLKPAVGEVSNNSCGGNV